MRSPQKYSVVSLSHMWKTGPWLEISSSLTTSDSEMELNKYTCNLPEITYFVEMSIQRYDM